MGHINSLATNNMTIKAAETVPKAKVLYFFVKRFYASITSSGTEKSFFAIMYLIVVILEKKALLDSDPEKNPVIFISLNSFDPELTGKEEGVNKMYNTKGPITWQISARLAGLRFELGFLNKSS